MSLDRNESGFYSLTLNTLTPFQDIELEEQSNELTAYDLEEYVLKVAGNAKVSPQDFDCESSTFIFRSSSVEAIERVLRLLFGLLEDKDLRIEHLFKKA